MIESLKRWWYRRALEGARIDLQMKKLEVEEAYCRVWFHEHRLEQLGD